MTFQHDPQGVSLVRPGRTQKMMEDEDSAEEYGSGSTMVFLVVADLIDGKQGMQGE
jgi:hypothetical protein